MRGPAATHLTSAGPLPAVPATDDRVGGGGPVAPPDDVRVLPRRIAVAEADLAAFIAARREGGP